MGLDERARTTLQALREAVPARRIVRIEYADDQGRASVRRVWPLGCFYWGRVWTLAAWCELRGDFRGFRIDRVAALELLDQRFPTQQGRTLADLLRREEAKMAARAAAQAEAASQAGAQRGLPMPSHPSPSPCPSPSSSAT